MIKLYYSVNATVPIPDDSDLFTYHDPDSLDSSLHIDSKYVVEGDAQHFFRFNDPYVSTFFA